MKLLNVTIAAQRCSDFAFWMIAAKIFSQANSIRIGQFKSQEIMINKLDDQNKWIDR